MDRDQIIVRTSVIGILANLALAVSKVLVGTMVRSIAVVMDGVNNLSDALSSVITIIGTKLAGRKPDREHPLGHGRIEYLSAMIIAAIVLYAGITALAASAEKIIHPETADYSLLSLILIGVSVAVKLLMGHFVKKTGKKVNSGSLIASGSDALYDAILSGSVLASALIWLICSVSLEAWVGAAIAVFIIRSGLVLLKETLDDILGKSADPDFLEGIRRTIREESEVLGVYDLILHNYGPDRYVGSVHVEVPDTLGALEIDAMERRIAHRVYETHGVLLFGVGIYAQDASDAVSVLRTEVTKVVMGHEGVLQVHGFYADLKKKEISLDMILDFDVADRDQLYAHIVEELKEKWPEYAFHVVPDLDI